MPWAIDVVMGPAKGGNKFVHLCASQMCHRKFMTESKVLWPQKMPHSIVIVIVPSALVF